MASREEETEGIEHSFVKEPLCKVYAKSGVGTERDGGGSEITSFSFSKNFGLLCFDSLSRVIYRVQHGNVSIIVPIIHSNKSSSDSDIISSSAMAVNEERKSLLICDSLSHSIKEVSLDNHHPSIPYGNLTTFAGYSSRFHRTRGYRNGNRLSSQFNNPCGISVSIWHNIVVSDTSNHVIRLIQGDRVTLLAGRPKKKGFRDGDPTEAKFSNPMGIACTKHGDVVVCDNGNRRVRLIDAKRGGQVKTLFGSGSPGLADGDHLTCQLDNPTRVLVTERGDMLIVSHHVRFAQENGFVSTFLEVSSSYDPKSSSKRSSTIKRPFSSSSSSSIPLLPMEKRSVSKSFDLLSIKAPKPIAYSSENALEPSPSIKRNSRDSSDFCEGKKRWRDKFWIGKSGPSEKTAKKDAKLDRDLMKKMKEAQKRENDEKRREKEAFERPERIDDFVFDADGNLFFSDPETRTIKVVEGALTKLYAMQEDEDDSNNDDREEKVKNSRIEKISFRKNAVLPRDKTRDNFDLSILLLNEDPFWDYRIELPVEEGGTRTWKLHSTVIFLVAPSLLSMPTICLLESFKPSFNVFNSLIEYIYTGLLPSTASGLEFWFQLSIVAHIVDLPLVSHYCCYMTHRTLIHLSSLYYGVHLLGKMPKLMFLFDTVSDYILRELRSERVDSQDYITVMRALVDFQSMKREEASRLENSAKKGNLQEISSKKGNKKKNEEKSLHSSSNRLRRSMQGLISRREKEDDKEKSKTEIRRPKSPQLEIISSTSCNLEGMSLSDPQTVVSRMRSIEEMNKQNLSDPWAMEGEKRRNFGEFKRVDPFCPLQEEISSIGTLLEDHPFDAKIELKRRGSKVEEGEEKEKKKEKSKKGFKDKFDKKRDKPKNKKLTDNTLQVEKDGSGTEEDDSSTFSDFFEKPSLIPFIDALSPDWFLKVGDEFIPCHGFILYATWPWFRAQIRQKEKEIAKYDSRSIFSSHDRKLSSERSSLSSLYSSSSTQIVDLGEEETKQSLDSFKPPFSPIGLMPWAKQHSIQSKEKIHPFPLKRRFSSDFISEKEGKNEFFDHCDLSGSKLSLSDPIIKSRKEEGPNNHSQTFSSRLHPLGSSKSKLSFSDGKISSISHQREDIVTSPPHPSYIDNLLLLRDTSELNASQEGPEGTIWFGGSNFSSQTYPMAMNPSSPHYKETRHTVIPENTLTASFVRGVIWYLYSGDLSKIPETLITPDMAQLFSFPVQDEPIYLEDKEKGVIAITEERFKQKMQKIAKLLKIDHYGTPSKPIDTKSFECYPMDTMDLVYLGEHPVHVLRRTASTNEINFSHPALLSKINKRKRVKRVMKDGIKPNREAIDRKRKKEEEPIGILKKIAFLESREHIESQKSDISIENRDDNGEECKTKSTSTEMERKRGFSEKTTDFTFSSDFTRESKNIASHSSLKNSNGSRENSSSIMNDELAPPFVEMMKRKKERQERHISIYNCFEKLDFAIYYGLPDRYIEAVSFMAENLSKIEERENLKRSFQNLEKDDYEAVLSFVPISHPQKRDDLDSEIHQMQELFRGDSCGEEEDGNDEKIDFEGQQQVFAQKTLFNKDGKAYDKSFEPEGSSEFAGYEEGEGRQMLSRSTPLSSRDHSGQSISLASKSQEESEEPKYDMLKRIMTETGEEQQYEYFYFDHTAPKQRKQRNANNQGGNQPTSHANQRSRDSSMDNEEKKETKSERDVNDPSFPSPTDRPPSKKKRKRSKSHVES